jgi:hypothetical protein
MRWGDITAGQISSTVTNMILRELDIARFRLLSEQADLFHG